MSSLEQDSQTKSKSHLGAYFVAAGILLSRLSGLIRMRALAHFLGDSGAGDAFYAAIKIPNFPQNLLGEGVLSASFIPVYASLLAKGDQKLADRVAGVVFSLLALVLAIIVAAGMLGASYMIDFIAPGFQAEKRELTIQLVRWIFPATGLLVLSAWCLGVLNSHHRFFLSYVAPVFSNLAVVVILMIFRNEPSQEQMAFYAAWGLVIGALVQFLFQLPATLKLVPELKLGFNTRLEPVREILRNFVPVVISRGVVQFSAYIDSIFASFLPSGAVAALGYAQSIYMLPISLFGMSVSAAELPTMAKAYGLKDFEKTLQTRINSASRRIAFFVVPSIVGFLVLGDAIVGLLFQTGKFGADTTNYVWSVLAGSAVGLLASTLGRLYSSAFYSLRDTRTPLKFSVWRVILTTVLGYAMGLKLPQLLGVDDSWGTSGLTASAGIAGWVEFFMLRRSLNQKIGPSGIDLSTLFRLWVGALVAGGICFAAKFAIPPMHPLIRGTLIIGIFGLVYFPVTALLGIDESKRWLKKLKR